MLDDILQEDRLADWLDELDIFFENILKEEDGIVRYFIVTYRWKWLRWLAAVGLFPKITTVQGLSKNRRLRPMCAKVGQIYGTVLRAVTLGDEADMPFLQLWYYDDLASLKYRHGGGTIYNADEEFDYDRQGNTETDRYGSSAGAVYKAGTH
jgi:hypothetical protein